MTLLLAVITCHCAAQTLSVVPIEAETGAQTSITVNIGNVKTDITALQFNLSLPEGIALNETGITKGNAVSGHEIVVRSLTGGDHLFVLYDMNKVLVTDGTLLTLPVTLPYEAGTLSGSLTAVRTATTSAVSQQCAEVSFTITVTKPVQSDYPMGDVDHNGYVNVTDVMMAVNYFIGQSVSGFYLENADFDKDNAVTLSEIMQIVNIALQTNNANTSSLVVRQPPTI